MTQLLPCSACGHSCAYDAKSCPNCGQPWPAQRRAPLPDQIANLIKQGFGIVMLGLGGVALYFFIRYLVLPILSGQ